jgi:TRAP-type uncharacterized transport system substrate-binding protein
MFRKLCLFLIVLLILCFVINIYTRRIEFFDNNYKSQLVQLKKEAVYPFTIAVGNENTYMSRLIDAYSKKFPLIVYNNEGLTYQNLSFVHNSLCDMAITQLELATSLYKGNTPYANQKNKSIRLICNLNYTSMMFLARPNINVTNWATFITYLEDTASDGSICVDTGDEASYHNFRKLMYLYGDEIFSEDFITREAIFSDDSDVIDRFIDGTIDILFLTAIHPNRDIADLYSQFQFQFIDISDMDLENLHVKSPFIVPQKLDLTPYTVNNQVQVISALSIPLCIVAHKDLSTDSVYRFLNGLFENLEYLRNSYQMYTDTDVNVALQETNFYQMITEEISYYKLQLQTLMPSKLYNIRTLLPFHEGAIQFFKKKGFITNNSDTHCVNFLPDGSPLDLVRGNENCNNPSANILERHYGHGHFG